MPGPASRASPVRSRPAARLLGIRPEQVLPFSTGVIMEPLPADRTFKRPIEPVRPIGWSQDAASGGARPERNAVHAIEHRAV